MESSPNARLFLAAWLAASTRAALQAWRDAARWPHGAKPTADDRLHLTLHFIGQVARSRVAELTRVLEVPTEPIELVLDRAEIWPGGVAVLRADSTPPALGALHESLAGAIDRTGIALERRHAFAPHVTLGWDATGVQFGVAPPVVWRFDGYMLAESSSGYHILHRFGSGG